MPGQGYLSALDLLGLGDVNHDLWRLTQNVNSALPENKFRICTYQCETFLNARSLLGCYIGEQITISYY